jgi:hypothetical protein
MDSSETMVAYQDPGYRIKNHQPDYYVRKVSKRIARHRIKEAGNVLERELGYEIFEALDASAADLTMLRDWSPQSPVKEMAAKLLTGGFCTIRVYICIPPHLMDTAVLYLIKESDALRRAEEFDDRWGDLEF